MPSRGGSPLARPDRTFGGKNRCKNANSDGAFARKSGFGGFADRKNAPLRADRVSRLQAADLRMVVVKPLWPSQSQSKPPRAARIPYGGWVSGTVLFRI
jgi:hypothetical protein